MSNLTTTRGCKAPSLRSRLEAKLALKTKALLLDTSGSMSWKLANGERRIDALRKVVAGLPLDLRTFCFNFYCEETNVVKDPAGGTMMDIAFTFIKNRGLSHAVLVTDGEPSCTEEAALVAARGLKLDVLYVGDDPAPPFLRRLAEATGGTYGKTDLQETKALEQKISGLLTAGRS